MILYSIHYSPWSLRALWALRHHGITFERREYVSMITTGSVRARLRDFSTPITVPLLVDGDVVLRDSVDIARWADANGSGTPLFGADDEEMQTWLATSEQISDAGRALTTWAVGRDPAAMLEHVPGFVPAPLRSFARPLVSTAAWYLSRKYGFGAADAPAEHRRLRAALESIANRLVDREYLADDFGFADIAAAAALQFVRPAEDWVALGDASRRCWTRGELAEEFSDLLVWRDGIVAMRPPKTQD